MSFKRYYQQVLAAEISSVSRYCDRIVQYAALEHDDGAVLEQIAGDDKSTAAAADRISTDNRARTAVLLNGNINYCDDVQGLLTELKEVLGRRDRVIAVCFNPYMQWLFSLLTLLGIRKATLPRNFIKRIDLQAICRHAGFEVVRLRPLLYCPRLLGLGSLVNRLLPTVPLVRWAALANVIILRPMCACGDRPSLSIVIPARNEAGNIEDAIKRLPAIDAARVEIIYVEGHSTDNTWEEIQRVQKQYKDTHAIQALQQEGKGKVDAVRLGFDHATGDVLTILDADLTMPPEYLDRFYTAYVDGAADFVNGSRLVYQMEKGAMRYLNVLGNIFFAKALSWVLDLRYGDVLCGTKLMSREDYALFRKWRDDFGDFDPFGDFELLFPAAQLGIGSIDLPIRYGSRRYGDTNISRFRHGLILLKMTLVGFFRIKLGKIRWRQHDECASASE